LADLGKMALDRPPDQAQPGGGVKAKFGSAAYAMDELRAELSSLLTAAVLSPIVPTLFPQLRPIMIDGYETATRPPVEQLG